MTQRNVFGNGNQLLEREKESDCDLNKANGRQGKRATFYSLQTKYLGHLGFRESQI